MKRFLISAVVSMACFMAHAQSITIPEVNLAPGGEKSVEVAIPNATNFTAFQFDLDLPDGITVKSVDIKGQPNTREIESGTVNGKYRVLSYDTKNTLLTADATLSLTLQASNETGTNEAEIESVVIVTSEGQPVTPDNNSFAINVLGGVELEFKEAGKLLVVRDIDLDFTSLEDEVRAYIVTGYDVAGDELILTRVRDVPAGTPIWVSGPASTNKVIPAGISKTYYPETLAVGNATEDTTVPATDSNYLNMTLSPTSGKPGRVTSAISGFPAGKAYLHLPINITSNVGSPVTVKLEAKGNKWAYVSPCDLDFSGVEGLSAYTITGFTSVGNSIWLSKVKKVSANTPLYLVGESNEYTIPSSAVEVGYANMLKGSATSTSNVKAIDGDFTTWILSKRDGVWGPIPSDDSAFPALKSYLPVPTLYIVLAASRGENVNLQPTEVEAEVISVKLNSLGGEDDGTTGIRELMNDGESDVWYNLKGQRIDTPTKKGLYIHNGRKVVVGK